MHRRSDTEHLKRGQYNASAVARRRTLLALSWYSSVPFGWALWLCSGQARDEAKGRGPPYVIQSFSATVQGAVQAYGRGSGYPQGGNRPAPFPPGALSMATLQGSGSLIRML